MAYQVYQISNGCDETNPLRLEAPPRGMVRAETVAGLRAWFDQWAGVAVPVGQRPGQYGDDWNVFEVSPPWVCGGIDPREER